jgi:spore coat protein CotF
MEDLLTQEKYMITSYGSFIPEASSQDLRQVLRENLEGCVQDQFTVFDQMSQLGWYQTKDAQMPEVQAARQKFQQMKTQMG